MKRIMRRFALKEISGSIALRARRARRDHETRRS